MNRLILKRLISVVLICLASLLLPVPTHAEPPACARSGNNGTNPDGGPMKGDYQTVKTNADGDITEVYFGSAKDNIFPPGGNQWSNNGAWGIVQVGGKIINSNWGNVYYPPGCSVSPTPITTIAVSGVETSSATTAASTSAITTTITKTDTSTTTTSILKTSLITEKGTSNTTLISTMVILRIGTGATTSEIITTSEKTVKESGAIITKTTQSSGSESTVSAAATTVAVTGSTKSVIAEVKEVIAPQKTSEIKALTDLLSTVSRKVEKTVVKTVKLPEKMSTTESALSLTPEMCSVSGLIITSLKKGLCKVAYTVTGSSNIPFTIEKTFNFTK